MEFLSSNFLNNKIMNNLIELLCTCNENKKEEYIYNLPKSNSIYRIEDIKNLNDKDGPIEI